MSKLFSPLTIKSLTLKNRIVVSPMCQYSSVDGFANDWHLVHLGSRAVGGSSLVIQEASAVSPEGRITYGDAGIWKDEHIEKWKQIATFIKSQGAIAGIQLAHAGRKASCDLPWKGGKQIQSGENSWQTVSASLLPFHESEIIPIALDKAGIEKIKSDFKSATQRALKAGYQLIDVHAAHGYLIHQFLSPISNQRTDEYGGSFENRTRLLLEIIDEINQVWPKDLPLIVRISATDWVEGGWDENQASQLSALLKSKDVDMIDVSSGGNVSHAKIPVGPNYQVPFAEKIRKETGILTSAVGLITNSQQVEDILQNGQADLIMIARELLRDPYFPLHAAKELGDDIVWADQYARAK
jgi:2,4-dienoyl-CoA reductase-like NADH-dependent reductase (Old Yellow Enzyme family)